MKSLNQFLTSTLMLMFGANQLSNVQPDKSAVIMARKNFTDCPDPAPLDGVVTSVYRNLVLVSDGCGDYFIVNISVASDSNVTTNVVNLNIPAANGLIKKVFFDKFGFIISIIKNNDRPSLRVNNQSMDGVTKGYAAGIPGDWGNTFSTELDRFNQVNIIARANNNNQGQLIWYKLNNTEEIAIEKKFEENNDDMFYNWGAAALTPRGNWIILTQTTLYSWTYKDISVIDTNLNDYRYCIQIINATAFYVSGKINGARHLLLYNYFAGNWTKKPVLAIPQECETFEIMDLKDSGPFNLLVKCVSQQAHNNPVSISILAYNVSANSGVLNDNAAITWKLNDTFAQSCYFTWLEYLGMTLIGGSVMKSNQVDGFNLEAGDNGWYWLLVNLKLLLSQSTKTPASINSATPIQKISTTSGSVSPIPTEKQDFNSIYILISVSLSLLLLILIAIIAIYLKKRRLVPYENNKENGPTTMHSITIGTMSTKTFNSMFTLNAGQKEFSIPGYLLVNVDKDVLMQQKIAAGGMGVVYLATIQNPVLRERCHTSFCIVKLMTSEINERELAAFRQEVAIMSFFQRHPNFAQIVGFAEQPSPVILMKHYSMGSLADWIHKENQPLAYSSRLALRFASNIITGILSMHRANLVHCDIKPANILLNQDAQYGLCAVLTDFGITRILDSTMLVRAFQVINKNGWSVAYCPPEAFKSMFASKDESSAVTEASECSQQILKSTDVYMFGMSVYEMISRKAPLSGVKSAEKVIDSVWKGERPPIDWELMKTDPILAGLADVVVQCWDQSPESRPLPQCLVETLRKLKIGMSPTSSQQAS